MTLPFLILAAQLVFSPEDAAVAYDAAHELVCKCTPRDAGTLRGKSAAYHILDSVSSTGADAVVDAFKTLTPSGEKTMFNVYAEFVTNPTSEWTVVVSHFDTKSKIDCPGANDGASTSGLLVGLANAFGRWRANTGNILLVWCDGEECAEFYSKNDGLHGSRRTVEMLLSKGRKVRAVICVDMLGDKDLNISIPRNSSKALAKIALFAADKIGEKGLVKQVDDYVKDDHLPFLENGMKSVLLIDFQYGSKPGLNDYWHTRNDTMDKISKDSLLKSGRLVARMLDVIHESTIAQEQ